MRVVILKEYAKKNFPATPLLDYAIEVEKITTSKVSPCLFNTIIWIFGASKAECHLRITFYWNAPCSLLREESVQFVGRAKSRISQIRTKPDCNNK